MTKGDNQYALKIEMPCFNEPPKTINNQLGLGTNSFPYIGGGTRYKLKYHHC
jgi:hypothetical protein